MVRKLSWLVALSALWCSMSVLALGLGDIDMHSALNQPISADIDLLAVHNGEADGINVTLGSVEDFARAGLERPYLLNQLRFLVVANGKGQYRIHIATEQPVREPFLDFLIQVTWKGGQLQREYTVLLDPPVLMPAPVQRIAAPITKAVTAVHAAPAVSVPLSSPAPIAAPPSAPPAAPQHEAPAARDSYGPVRRTDTLWGIANRTRPDASVSVEQMMQATLRANPGAFIGNNINNLKAGRILRIPSPSEIDAINPQQALQDTRAQNDAWRNQRTVAAPAAKPAKPVVETKPATAEETAKKPTETAEQKPAAPAPDQVQLKVVAPAPEDAAKAESAVPAPVTATTPPAGAPPAAEGSDVHKELALTTEAVETQRQETEDLRTRLTDLEQQITTMQKLMAIKDEQLSSIQAKNVGAASASGGDVPKETDGLLNNPATLAMIGIVALVLAALLWVALRRRQLGEPVSAPPLQREIRVEPRATTASASVPEPAVSSAATVAAAAGVASAAAIRAATQSGSVTAAPRPVAKAVPEQNHVSDPLSEADIYLAYGRYQQAEDLIKEAMRHDRNPELNMKLLEIYYAAKNSTGFEDVARDLRHEVGTDGVLWERVLPMGRELCPYSLLFNADQGDELPDAAVIDTPAASSVPTVPDSYDFDLGTEVSAAPTPLQADQGHFDLGSASEDADTLDEVGTKLDLARAYIDMGDPEGARSILDEVLQEGSAKQKDEAQELLQRLAN